MKLGFRLSALSFLCIAILPFGLFAQGKSWLLKMQDPDVNFWELQKEFNEYWKNRTDYKANGYKVFKRWEYINQLRAAPDGRLQAPDEVIQEYERYMANTPQSKSASGTWSLLGPFGYPDNNTSQPTGKGRVNGIGFHPTDPNVIFIGTSSGGIWKSINGGANWSNISANIPFLGVSAILIHPTNPDIIYIGTGDRDGKDAPGIGVYKSMDGGDTWQPSNIGMGSVTVAMMMMEPGNPDVMLACTRTGIYKSTDAGASWVRNLTGDIRDIKYKPGDPSVVYATKIVSAGAALFYRSTDGGNSWSLVDTPTDGVGARMVIGVTAANPDYVYLVQIDAADEIFKALLRSTDSGESFTEQSNSPNILGYNCAADDVSSQATYDLCIEVDQNDANIVYVGGINTWKSINGGVSWTPMSHWVGSDFSNRVTDNCAVSVHADHHVFIWSPHAPTTRLYLGHDGGISYTDDGGATWVEISNDLSAGQIYKIGQSVESAGTVVAGFQDNGVSATSDGATFTTIGGGDGFDGIIDYSNPLYCYHAINGTVRRSIAGLYGAYSNISSGISGTPSFFSDYKLHHSNPNTMFFGRYEVWRSTNVRSVPSTSVAWSAISSFSDTKLIRVIEQSAINTNIMYVSRGDGTGSVLYRSDNVNANVNSVVWNTIPRPNSSYAVSDIAASPTDENIVFATAGTKVYKSTNKGASWTDITSNLPALFINCMAIDKNADEGIYIGNQTGVWYKDASLTDWILFSSGLPPVDIQELEIYNDANPENSRITAGTYGRGVWQSDLAEINVLNPSNFTAYPISVSQIDLSWSLNASNNNVLIATSSTTIFGVPVDGTAYTVGNTLPGGGTVIYVGNLTNFSHTGLTDGTTYCYKIWSVNSGNQYSAGMLPVCNQTFSHYWTGNVDDNWFNTGNWGPGTVPTATDGVYIPAGRPNYPLINADGASCNHLTIEAGASVAMDAVDSYLLEVTGDWTNNGSFTPGVGTVYFSGTNPLQKITGTSTSDFYMLEVDKGSVSNILDALSPITLNALVDEPLALYSGTFRLSNAASNITVIRANGFDPDKEIGFGKRFWVAAGTLNVNSDWRMNGGELRITGGNVNVGNTQNQRLEYINNGTLVMTSGTLTVASGIWGNGPARVSSGVINISGGVITLGTQFNGFARGIFEVNAACSFTMSGGTIILQSPNTYTSHYYNLATTSSVTGGTLQVGNASTPSGQTFRIHSTVPVYNLTISTTNAPTAQLVNSNLTVLNDVIISGGTLNANSLNLSVGGHWTNNGIFAPGTGTVTFNGANNQNLGGSASTAFYNMTMNNATGLSLSGTVNVTVNGILSLNAGVISTGNNQLIISSTGSVARNSGHIFGYLRKNVSTGTNISRTFELGDAAESNYTPVSLNFASVSITGDLIAKAFAADHPQIGSAQLTASKSVNRYWSIANSGTGFSICDAVFNFLAADLDAGANTSNLICGKYDAPNWSYPTVSVKTAGSVEITGVSSFSDFQLAEPCSNPDVPTLSATANTICTGQTVTLSITTGDLNGATNWQWYSGSCGSSAVGSGTSINVSPTTNTQYYVRGEGGCLVSFGACATISVEVMAQPLGPTLDSKIPNVADICTGTEVSATINAGSGGTGCSDDYVVVIDGGSPEVYMPGTNVGGSATSSIVIRGRRANCSSGSGCTGTAYVDLASWAVVAQPTGPTLNTKTPNLGTICSGTGVSATFNAGSGGTGCTDDYVVVIDGGSPVAYTPGLSVGFSATSSIVIRGRRANCNTESGCNGTTYVDLASWTLVEQPTGPTLVTKTPTLNDICSGTGASATFNAGSGGTGCTDDYVVVIDGGSPEAYTPGTTVGISATSSIVIRGRRANCTTESGCNGTGYTDLATWNINVILVNPSLAAKSPNLNAVCSGTSVSATFNAGSGGTGCSDDYVVVIDGGSPEVYTPGTNVGGSATSSIVIRGRRANCSGGSGCTGTAYVDLASWTVVAQPTGPTLNTKTPNLGTVCSGTGVSATFNAGSGGTGCSDDYVVVIDGGSPAAYTPGSTVGSGATSSVVIRGRRANCTSGSGCNGTAYVDLASWVVVAQPTGPTLTTKSPNLGTICAGTGAGATFNDGSGGAGCTADYVVVIDGGSPEAYTPGTTVGINATSSIVIRGRRANCSIGSGCIGTAYIDLASWVVVAQPTGPTLNAKSPNLGTICSGTGVSATFNAGSGGTGCSDDYVVVIDGGSHEAYTPGTTVGISATSSIVIRGRRANCSSTDCNGTAYINLASWTVVAQPTAPTLIAKTPNLGTICAGTGVIATFNGGSGGTGCSVDYVVVIDGGTPSAYTPNTFVGYGATSSIVIRGRRANCSSGSGCTGTAYVDLASWVVVAQPTGPTLNAKSPNLGTICSGTGVNATFNAGSGGTGCTDDYVVVIDGGSPEAYTPGSTVGISATNSIVIRGRRANCSSGSGCTGTAYVDLASWTVVAQPTGPTLNTKTPNLGTVCSGTGVSATFNAGSGGTGCSDDYVVVIDGGSPAAYTPGSTVGSGATSSVVIRGRRANCSSGSGCNGTAYVDLASWAVVAQPTGPTLNAKTPDLVEVCGGVGVSATFNAGSGGAGCTDDYVVVIDGGSPAAYTPGSTVGSGASSSIVIRGRRANCNSSSSCNGTAYVDLASWNVIGEIDIRGNNQSIEDGDNTPNTNDLTDFGSVAPSVSIIRTFVIHNTGGLPLSIGSITSSDNTNFIVGTLSPAGPILAGGNASFTVSFNAASVGTFLSTISVANSDCSEALYDFAIRAVIDCSTPTFTACPGNQNVTTDPNQCNAVVSYNVAATGSPLPLLSYSFTGATSGSGSGTGSGQIFGKGITQLVVSATNNCGSVNCVFSIVVNDNQLPVVSCPTNIVKNNDMNQCGSVTNYNVTGSDNCSNWSIQRISGLQSGALFPVGSSTVIWKNTDGAGNSSTCSFTVTVNDAQLPTITCPVNLTANAAMGSCAATVNYNNPVAADNCTTVILSHVSGGVSGSSFNKGVNTIQWKATDGANNTMSCTFTITVNDTQLPNITCPANITANTAAGTCAATVNFANATATDNCTPPPTVAQTSGQASGSSFAKGLHTLSFKATDGAGLTKSCTFRITVVDNVLPTITCPPNIVKNTDNNLCSAVTTYTVTGADNCTSVSTTKVSGLASGSAFPRGSNTVIWRATDLAGNSTLCSFTVTVSDAQLPGITCPTSISTNTTTGQCSKIVNYTTPTYSDNCAGGSISLFSGLASGSTFPTGVSTVVWRAIDNAANSNTCAFTVTVTDNELPTITCPPAATVAGSGSPCGYPASQLSPATATDNCAVTSLTNDAPTTLPAGPTTITWTAKDAANNQKTCAYVVTVNCGASARDEVGSMKYEDRYEVGSMKKKEGSDVRASSLIPHTSSLTLFPNPASDMVVITWSDQQINSGSSQQPSGSNQHINSKSNQQQIIIYDAWGRIVWQQKVSAEARQLQVDLSGAMLADGIYRVVLRTEAGTLSKKLVLSRL